MLPVDVLVVGAGPAGLATAIAASQKNLRVLLVDPRKPPIDKPCGEGLLPEAVAALERIGIDLHSSAGFPFEGFRFSDESSFAEARIPRGRAFGLRRTVLHRMLADRAAEAGVSLLWGSRISRLDRAGACIDGQFVACKWLIGADGQNSVVRRFAGLDPSRPARFRFGFRRHYALAPWTNCVEVHWGAGAQAIVTPTGAGEICVSIFSDSSRLRMDRMLEHFPELTVRLRGAQPLSSVAGSVTSSSVARAVVRGNVALVGDASCAVDAVSGQGLSLAFRQALALADALGAGNLASYESAHRRITCTPIRVTRLLLTMHKSAAIRRRALRLFAAKPALFEKLIAVHTGDSSPVALDAAEILGLGWRVLWA